METTIKKITIYDNSQYICENCKSSNDVVVIENCIRDTEDTDYNSQHVRCEKCGWGNYIREREVNEFSFTLDNPNNSTKIKFSPELMGTGEIYKSMPDINNEIIFRDGGWGDSNLTKLYDDGACALFSLHIAGCCKKIIVLFGDKLNILS